mmetsp:Transcript_57503/g.136794  ORF Transcript_57503/g.136794 Transcript_57503/m.136794 type:complete len:263 (+) Transcript_57503:571-1359(+)
MMLRAVRIITIQRLVCLSGQCQNPRLLLLLLQEPNSRRQLQLRLQHPQRISWPRVPCRKLLLPLGHNRRQQVPLVLRSLQPLHCQPRGAAPGSWKQTLHLDPRISSTLSLGSHSGTGLPTLGWTYPKPLRRRQRSHLRHQPEGRVTVGVPIQRWLCLAGGKRSARRSPCLGVLKRLLLQKDKAMTRTYRRLVPWTSSSSSRTRRDTVPCSTKLTARFTRRSSTRRRVSHLVQGSRFHLASPARKPVALGDREMMARPTCTNL